jgi:acyl carrier protein
MTNIEKYAQTFTETFGISADKLPALEYQAVPEWDSVGHMALVAALEAAFDIMLDTEDIIGFSSFEKGKEILKKYGVEL